MSETESERQPSDQPISKSEDSVDTSSDDAHNISIKQSFHRHQIDVFFPGLESLGNLAESNPELATKVFDQLDKQRIHRQQIENLVITGNDRRSSRAQILSWLFAMVALIGAIG